MDSSPLQQEAEVFLPGQTRLGRELVCWEVRQGELQAPAGKNKTTLFFFLFFLFSFFFLNTWFRLSLLFLLYFRYGVGGEWSGIHIV